MIEKDQGEGLSRRGPFRLKDEKSRFAPFQDAPFGDEADEQVELVECMPCL